MTASISLARMTLQKTKNQRRASPLRWRRSHEVDRAGELRLGERGGKDVIHPVLALGALRLRHVGLRIDKLEFGERHEVGERRRNRGIDVLVDERADLPQDGQRFRIELHRQQTIGLVQLWFHRQRSCRVCVGKPARLAGPGPAVASTAASSRGVIPIAKRRHRAWQRLKRCDTMLAAVWCRAPRSRRATACRLPAAPVDRCRVAVRQASPSDRCATASLDRRRPPQGQAHPDPPIRGRWQHMDPARTLPWSGPSKGPTET